MLSDQTIPTSLTVDNASAGRGITKLLHRQVKKNDGRQEIEHSTNQMYENLQPAGQHN